MYLSNAQIQGFRNRCLLGRNGLLGAVLWRGSVPRDEKRDN